MTEYFFGDTGSKFLHCWMTGKCHGGAASLECANYYNGHGENARAGHFYYAAETIPSKLINEKELNDFIIKALQ